MPVSYTHLRAHETRGNLVCRLLLEKKKEERASTQKTPNISKKLSPRHRTPLRVRANIKTFTYGTEEDVREEKNQS